VPVTPPWSKLPMRTRRQPSCALTPGLVDGHHEEMAVLKVATCQFPVSADIGSNLRYIKRQMGLAQRAGARVVHFPEGSLSGYAGTDFESFADFDWDRLHDATVEVAEHAHRLQVWAVLGSAHRTSNAHKPHNSSYVVDDSGQIAERYDKRFCSGGPDERSGDLAHYTPGDHFSVWTIDGVSCGALICYDYRFPELYREYKKLGVQLMFHSFHAAHASAERIAEVGKAIGPEFKKLNRAATHTYPGITMPAAMTTAAACNHVWISCPNSSAPQSCWAAFLVRADGVTTGRLRRNVPGVLVSSVDTEQELYDSTAPWRERAMGGVLHSGTLASYGCS
jgi:predicted amidohydrolase